MSKEIKSALASKQEAPKLDGAQLTEIEKRKKMTFEERQRDLRNKAARDAEEVVGVFKNLETPGGSVEFGLKLYPDDNFDHWWFVDNERYRIPRGVARHLNNNCYYIEYKFMDGQKGADGVRGGYNDGKMKSQNMLGMRKVHRFSFQSLEFMDEDLAADLRPADIMQVTSV